MVANTFFYALIIVAGLIILFVFLKRGQSCVGCSENFQQAPRLSKEAEYRKKKRQELNPQRNYDRDPDPESPGKVRNFVSNHYPVWKGYDKYSLYSTMVSPPNINNYPYMNSPYDQLISNCSSQCRGEHQTKCLMECTLHALDMTLPPIR